MGSNQSSSRIPLEYHSDVQTQNGSSAIYKLGEHYVQKLFVTVQSNPNSLLQTLRLFMKQEKHLQRIYNVQLDNSLTCVREQRIVILCDYYSYTLKDVIGRKIGKTRMCEEEIWYILRVVVQAGYFLQKRQLIIGDIKPQTLFISHDHQLKIPVTNIRNNFQNSNYLQSFLCFKQGCLLSPEQLQQIKQGRKSQINHYKSDVFALGMTILQCCSKLDSSIRFYKYSTYSISYQKVNAAIQQLRLFYSDTLINLLFQLLNVQQSNRPDFRYLCGWLDTKSPVNNVNCFSFQQRSSNTTDDSLTIKRAKNINKFSLKR